MIEDRNVAGEIYPDEDYEGEVEQGYGGPYDPDTRRAGPPRLWVDALPIRELAADDSLIYTVALLSPGNAAGVVLRPTRVIPKAPNNTRRRATLVVSTNDCVLLATPDPVTIAQISGVTTVPTGFHLVTTRFFEYTSGAELWAAGRGGTGVYSFLSIVLDYYKPVLL